MASHPDELTVNVPFLAVQHNINGVFILPCCLYDFDGAAWPNCRNCTDAEYHQYLDYIESKMHGCGFEFVHRERVVGMSKPNRNICLIGMRRIPDNIAGVYASYSDRMQHLKASYLNSVGAYNVRRSSDEERERVYRKSGGGGSESQARRRNSQEKKEKTQSSHFKPARRTSGSNEPQLPPAIGDVNLPLAGRGASQSPSNRMSNSNRADVFGSGSGSGEARRVPARPGTSMTTNNYNQSCYKPVDPHHIETCACCRRGEECDDVNMNNDPYACAAVESQKQIGVRENGKRSKVINYNWF